MANQFVILKKKNFPFTLKKTIGKIKKKIWNVPSRTHFFQYTSLLQTQVHKHLLLIPEMLFANKNK